MNSGEVASLVALVGMVFSAIGITGIDSSVLNGAVNGVICVIAIGAAIVSWYQHHNKVQ